MARREERAYREDVSDEQRSQPGCPARELCDESLLRDTRRHSIYWRPDAASTIWPKNPALSSQPGTKIRASYPGIEKGPYLFFWNRLRKEKRGYGPFFR